MPRTIKMRRNPIKKAGEARLLGNIFSPRKSCGILLEQLAKACARIFNRSKMKKTLIISAALILAQAVVPVCMAQGNAGTSSDKKTQAASPTKTEAGNTQPGGEYASATVQDWPTWAPPRRVYVYTTLATEYVSQIRKDHPELAARAEQYMLKPAESDPDPPAYVVFKAIVETVLNGTSKRWPQGANPTLWGTGEGHRQ